MMKNLKNELDEICRKSTGRTFDELCEMPAEEVVKYYDKLNEELQKSINEMEKDTFEKKKEMMSKDLEKTGEMFGVFKSKYKGHEGYTVEATGNISEILYMIIQGISSILKEHFKNKQACEEVMDMISKMVKEDL